MSARLFSKGLQAFANKEIDWDTDNIKATMLILDGSATDVGVKAITAASNATPIVVTSTAHGGANGDIVVIRGVVGNTAANGTWQIANQTANTFELKTVHGAGLNSVGNGVYVSGGCLLNLTLADFLDDISAGRVGTDHTNLTGKTLTDGVLDCADLAFATFTGTVHGIAFWLDAGTEATDRLIYFLDGKTQVVVAADAAGAATTLWVEPLEGAIPNGATIVFSNGVTATLTSGAAAGARSLAVSSLSGAIAAGHTGDAQTTGSGLPASVTSGGLSVTIDNGANKLVKL